MRRYLDRVSLGRHEAAIGNAKRTMELGERAIAVAVNDALAAGMTYEDAAKLLGISRATLHRRYVQTQQTLRLSD